MVFSMGNLAEMLRRVPAELSVYFYALKLSEMNSAGPFCYMLTGFHPNLRNSNYFQPRRIRQSDVFGIPSGGGFPPMFLFTNSVSNCQK